LLYLSIGHALAQQRFTSYEDVRKWLDDGLAGLAQKSNNFFGVTSTNCQTDGKNV